jgi:hypothetical protein
VRYEPQRVNVGVHGEAVYPNLPLTQIVIYRFSILLTDVPYT